MTGARRTVPVFISSTFRDMQGERDWLVKRVFPALRETFERFRVDVVDIDLRWGVTREQADNDQAAEVCLDQAVASRPFMVGILGERYGHIAGPAAVRLAAKYGWFEAPSDKSITELEIICGALNDPETRRHSLFLFRDKSFIDTLPRDLRGDYEGESEEATDKLNELKAKIRKSGAKFVSYSCSFGGVNRKAQVQVAGLEEFGRQVADWLEPAIRTRLKVPKEPPSESDPDELEDDFHARFAASRVRVYVGRPQLDGQLTAFADEPIPAACLVTGPPGAGKSAALAHFATEYARHHPETAVVSHFVGASPASTDPRHMLQRLCRIVQSRFALGGVIPQDLDELASYFRELINRVPAGRRLVLVLDALNQLGGADHRALSWLPGDLPAGVKLVASRIAEDEGSAAIERAFPTARSRRIPAPALDDAESRQIIRAVPSLSAKTLDDMQVDLLLSNPATANPLFLLVALEELRGFGSFDELDTRIATLPRPREPDPVWRQWLETARRATSSLPDAKSRIQRLNQIESELKDRQPVEDALTAMFLQVIDQLETDFDPRVTAQVLSLIASAREGLSEAELRGLVELSLPDADTDWLRDEVQGVLRRVRTYLMRKGPLVDFYHRRFWTAVRARYLLSDEQRVAGHGRLVNYFKRQGYWLVDPQTKKPTSKPNVRVVAELPWQLAQAGRWPELAKLLCALAFVESKCAAGMVFDLAADLKRCHAAALPTDKAAAVEDFSKFIASQAHFLARCPGSAFQQALNEPDESAPGMAARTRLASGKEQKFCLEWLNKSKESMRPGRTLPGHADGANACAFAPHGPRLLVAASGGACHLWDTATGKQVALLRPRHKGPGSSAWNFSPDGALVVGSGNLDGSSQGVQVWEAETGRLVRTFDCPGPPATGLAVSPDASWLASFHADGSVRLWDLSSGKQLAALWTPSRGLWGRVRRAIGFGRTTGCGFSTDGHLLVAKDSWGRKMVWSAATGGPVPAGNEKIAYPCSSLLNGQSFSLQDSRVARLACFRFPEFKAVEHIEAFAKSPDGRSIVTGHADKSLRVWDTTTGEQLTSFAAHSNRIGDIAYSPDGYAVASASSDGTVKLWPAEALAAISTQRSGHTGEVRGVAFSPDGRRVASASWVDGTVRIWDGSTGEPLAVTEKEGAMVSCCAFSADGAIGASGTFTGTVRAWDAATGRTLWFYPEIGRDIPFRHQPIVGCSFAADSSHVLVLNQGGWIGLLENNGIATAGQSHEAGILSCAFSPDGRLLAMGTWDGTIAVWHRGREPRGFHRAVQFSPSGPGGKDLAWACAFSPDGRWLASCHHGGEVRVWDIVGVQLRATLSRGPDPVQSCCFSPDGHHLAAGYADDTIRVWDWAANSLVCEWGVGSLVTSLAWRRDGQVLAAGDKQGRVLLARVLNA